ncbi:MAG TPA: hypothetical protein VIP77_17090 [Jiangellaceae bacterium]
MAQRLPVFEGLADLEAAEPALVAAHLLVEVFATALDDPKARVNWYPIGQQLARLGGCESDVGFFRGSATANATRDVLALECVLLWEAVALAGRLNSEVLLLRAGRAALASATPVETVANAIRGRRFPSQSR